MTTLRAHFDGKVIIPEGPVDLPKGRPLEIQVTELDSAERGSPEAILQALGQSPHLTATDVDALESSISQGRLPFQQSGAFDDDRDVNS